MKLSILRFHAIVAATMFATIAFAEHTSNWAVLVCTSRFWFNYRHLANVLSMYRTVKRLGIPDSQIILMLPDDMACNPRNAFPGTVYSNSDRAVDLYGDNIEVDYRGYEVTVENFIRLLTDRVGAEMPRSKRLLTDDRSNILVYMTGHGGNEFLKFQDAEEIGAFDLANAFEEMWEKKRYHEILFMIDTCQANTMYSRLYSPNIIATGSSKLDQSSYSHHADNDVGVAVIDRYTYYNLEFLENNVKDLNSQKTVGELFDSYDFGKIHSHAGVRYDLFPGGEENARSRLITDFFGNIQNVEVDRSGNLTLEEDLLALSKKIALLQQREAEAAKESVGEKVSAKAPASAPTETARKIQKAKALTDDNWWTKKVVAWSCDAELAVATDDTIYIFLPEYPRSGGPDEGADEEELQSQYTLSYRASGLIRPDPTINAQLCSFSGIRVAGPPANDENWFPGVGNGLVTGSGAPICQIVRLEWSPNGLGCNLRPILTALSTSGCIYAIGEHIDRQSAMIAGMRVRSFKAWKTLWGLGAQLPLPDSNEEDGYRNMNERIQAFSWAKEVDTGRGLLAYCNDVEEVAVMAVQLFSQAKEGDPSCEETRWDIQEVGRFDGRGRHIKEDLTWPEIVYDDDKPIVRGVVADPFNVKPFQVSFVGDAEELAGAHYTWECSTTYSKEDEIVSSNPISGLLIHDQGITHTGSVPYYSIARLSATSRNQDWFQTNLPDSEASVPKWATRIRKHTTRLVARAVALEGLDSDSDDSEDDLMDDDAAQLQVPESRYRIWGMVHSPGGGTTAVLVSRYSTLHPERRALCKLMFSRRDEERGEYDAVTPTKPLTTEGQVWEWMYGNAPEVLGTTATRKISPELNNSLLREQFRDIAASQHCVFCDAALRLEEEEAKCENGHLFARCASTGLAIMAPDISRICAVCELRCLKVAELKRVVETHFGPEANVQASGEVCGGCGGKFVA
ncbi:GPI-anchor transamidase [Fusarium oxysporum]|uniref:GPI-anchor transamidase n=1 Tax=Fusarium oxysporum TaxID=5507 RepID=A0A420R2H1_FUSOX|nr:GPI-anchor transamidase [Fusarium oxysporum]